MNLRSAELLLGAILVLILMAGCHPAPPTATDVLKQSMSTYEALQSFQANADSQAFMQVNNRSISYVKPNKFKVVSTHAMGFDQTSVCDGAKVVEYAPMVGKTAQNYPAPTSLATATSMQMQMPMFCGTLLCKFFGGPADIDQLVDSSKGSIDFGPDEKIDGQVCNVVKFYAIGMYGHTEVSIGSTDHLVRRITYDSEPLQAMLKGQLGSLSKGALATMSRLASLVPFGIGISRPLQFL
jgi:hypothetical protein